MFFGSGIKRFSGRNIFFTGKIADSQISHLYKKVTDYCNLISRQRNLPEKQIIVPALKVKKTSWKKHFLAQEEHLLSIGEASQTQNFFKQVFLSHLFSSSPHDPLCSGWPSSAHFRADLLFDWRLGSQVGSTTDH